MKNHLISKLTKILAFFGFLLPVSALGQSIGISPIDPINAGGSGEGTIMFILNTIINFSLGLLILLAVVIIIYIAYLYLFAGGDAEKAKTARRYLVYVVVAIAVGLLSKVLIFVVFELTGAGIPTGL